MYLQGILDRTHDQFIRETIEFCKKRMNGINDRRRFTELAEKLRSVKINIDKYY